MYAGTVWLINIF